MIEVRAELPAALPPVLADATQIQRIIMNLGTNAAQAVGAAQGRILIRAGESSAGLPPSMTPVRCVRLTVEDNGRGMDNETLRHIFDPFFTTKEVGQGTGLGLSVVHGIVETHGGAITVQSRRDAGTTFQIHFPITAETTAPVLPEANEPPPAGAGEKVLIVDDEAVVLKVTRAMLTRLGYTVDACTDSAETLAAFMAAPQSYRLLITDFAMPRMDGVELARRIWKEQPGFPIILYSGYGGRLTPEEAIRMGFVRLRPKPFQLNQLAEAVQHALDHSKPPR